jgi:ubiquinone/menaquinone biosynthesis C-methylase UbiE
MNKRLLNSRYDKSIGYLFDDSEDSSSLHEIINVNKKIIGEYYSANFGDLILDIGVGFGQEAVLLQKEFSLQTIAIDLHPIKKSISNQNDDLVFLNQNAMALAFAKNSFSLVYCYHVLEHVDNHIIALGEIDRVLKPGGVLFIGFPNKNRLISYIGTNQKTSLLDKIKWNVNDYFHKIQGKFENRYGAHAGFTQSEFIKDAASVFDTIYPVRNNYILLKYPRLRSLIRFIIAIKLEEVIFPSNYFICIKKHS